MGGKKKRWPSAASIQALRPIKKKEKKNRLPYPFPCDVTKLMCNQLHAQLDRIESPSTVPERNRLHTRVLSPPIRTIYKYIDTLFFILFIFIYIFFAIPLLQSEFCFPPNPLRFFFFVHYLLCRIRLDLNDATSLGGLQSGTISRLCLAS